MLTGAAQLTVLIGQPDLAAIAHANCAHTRRVLSRRGQLSDVLLDLFDLLVQIALQLKVVRHKLV